MRVRVCGGGGGGGDREAVCIPINAVNDERKERITALNKAKQNSTSKTKCALKTNTLKKD